jgi:hypothetical protein
MKGAVPKEGAVLGDPPARIPLLVDTVVPVGQV